MELRLFVSPLDPVFDSPSSVGVLSFFSQFMAEFKLGTYSMFASDMPNNQLWRDGPSCSSIPQSPVFESQLQSFHF
ncbi:unnamed protein product [Cuscuta campestris]|uniref:Uncharacterized protein n=1 Tax=Cuscuta campestris TaxID=132261 RepID=A0A484KZW5_9ASTE|nr:unnamed protein product [Cuscuta campestris]